MDIGINSVGMQSNRHLAHTLLKYMVEGDAPDEVVALFSESVSFEIPGDDDALPWIGRANGKPAVVR